ncbi:MAG TPA: type II toxin-antitoxin system YafQ family toxin [Rhizomicrobium sp.]|jgi:mRNA interferase YafQ|nr:type II toxin-antitoxin system YafQ family toxin [Rhizomicrobium sp.]
MRTISRTTQFKRDYKRESKGQFGETLESDLRAVLELLLSDAPLPPKHRDHPLSGQWKQFRDCHVRPDLVLVYRKPNASTLELVRLGSHSELSF